MSKGKKIHTMISSWLKWSPGMRKKMNELKRQAFFADQIIDTSRSMITIINRNYEYEKVNRTFCTNHNRVADQIVGLNLADVWGKENFNRNIKGNIDTCFSGKVVYYRAFFETPAGGKRYYEVVFRPIKDVKDKITHALAETFDITEIKLKEQAAVEIEWEFRNLESNLPIGFFRCDINGKILYVNKALMRILKSDSETEITGRSLREYYNEPELFDIHLQTLMEENVSSFGRVVLNDMQGEQVISRISAFIVNDGSGNTVYIDGAIEDFTNETNLEKKLRQSQKLDTIGLLAGGIAHDFNTILTTIYGYAEMSLEGLDKSSETYQNLRKINQALGRARSLTNQILTFSRQVGQEKIRVRVSDILQETLSFLNPSTPEGVTVEDVIKAPDAYVMADPTQLFRVFINLANNGIQAMEQKGGRLTVILEKREVAGPKASQAGIINQHDFAVIRFEDTGPGMDEGTAERIFEPFYTTKKQGKGTGLGLSVVYGIITELDGDITVSSRKNAGTVVEVTIPLAESQTGEQSGAAPRAGIMLIPGNDNEARLISMALTSSGFNVAASDPSGNWMNKADLADLVIIIDKSPEMPAMDLVFSMNEFGVTTPVLVISDFDVWLASEKELSSGIVSANLFKPVSLKEIIYSIDSLLNKQS